MIATGACRFDLALIDLVVHQSADESRRRTTEPNVLDVTYVLDEIVPENEDRPPAQDVDGFTFGFDAASTTSLEQRLQPYPQRMTLALAVGNGAGFALQDSLAVGRVDPLFLPAAEQGPINLDALAFLTKPDGIEPLNADIPVAGVQALCDNRAGFVNVVGSEAAYGFVLEQLELVANEAGFSSGGDDVIACDVANVFEDGELIAKQGAVMAVHGLCGAGETEHTVVFDVGGPRETILPAELGELCDPFVHVVTLADNSSRVWVATRTFAALYAFNLDGRDDGALLDRTEFVPLLEPPVSHVLLADGALIASGFDDANNRIGTIVRRISDAALQGAVPAVELDAMIAGDPSGEAALFEDEEGNADDGRFTLRVPDVAEDSAVVTYPFSRPVLFDTGFVPTRILVLRGDDADPNNDVVVGMDDAGRMQIEGGELQQTQRNRFAVTFGRAVILAGDVAGAAGVGGHDVVVRAFDKAERDLLEAR
jgi:hypothetical protein